MPPALRRDSGQEEEADRWEGGALRVTSSEKTDLGVLGAGLVLPTYGKGVGS